MHAPDVQVRFIYIALLRHEGVKNTVKMNTSESSNTHKNMTLSEYDFFKGYHRVKGANWEE